MPKLSDISNRAIRQLIGCYSTGAVVPASSSGAVTYATVQAPAASTYLHINGKKILHVNLTAQACTALAALQNPVTGQDGFYVQPASTTVYYLIVQNIAKTAYVIQGNYTGRVITGRAGRSGIGVSEMPDIAVDDTYAPIGAFKCVTGTTAMTIGTTNLDATTGSMAFTWASVSHLGSDLPTFA